LLAGEPPQGMRGFLKSNQEKFKYLRAIFPLFLNQNMYLDLNSSHQDNKLEHSKTEKLYQI